MNNVIDEREYKGYSMEIIQDEYPLDNRSQFDNLGTMVCFHNKYKLGDDKHGLNSKDFNGWSDMEKYLIKEKGAAIVIPIYMYDHSGITIATKPFSCPWDSGQIGFIYVSKDAIHKEYKCKRITKDILNKVSSILENEVVLYDDILTGNVFIGMVKAPKVENSEDDTVIDSCGGYFIDHTVPYSERFNYIYSEMQSQIEYDIKVKSENSACISA